MSEFNELQDLSPPNGKKEYQTQWNQMQSAWASNRIPQSMLFVGSFDYAFMAFVKKLTQLIFCKKRKISLALSVLIVTWLLMMSTLMWNGLNQKK